MAQHGQKYPMDDNSSVNRYFLEIQNCFENISMC